MRTGPLSEDEKTTQSRAEARWKIMDFLGLPRGNTVLSTDDRRIMSIWWDDRDDSSIQVGKLNVTEILAYDEAGQAAHVPWLAVIKEGVIDSRVPAYKVTISYAGRI